MSKEKDQYLNIVPFIRKEQSDEESGEMGDLKFCIEYFRDCAAVTTKENVDDSLNEILKNGLEIFVCYAADGNKPLIVNNLLKAYYIVRDELVKE